MNHRFHDIPASDALIGIYSAYYIGEKGNPVKDHLNVVFNRRAMNTYNMDAAMEAGFGKPDSPWIMLDHRSDARRDPNNNGQDMAGGHFIAMYHKASRQVMIALPGMEYDDGPKDTLDDIKELSFGKMKTQSAALYQYAQDVQQKMQNGGFTGPGDFPLTYSNDKPIIGSHSMGCTAAQMMAVDGYKTILVEPRPVHDGLIKRLIKNLSKTRDGAAVTPDQALEQLDKNTINLRTRHCNVWNSVLLPWVKQRDVGMNFTYGNEKPATLLDRFITTLHGVEQAVPSLMNTADAKQAKGYKEDVMLTPQEGPQKRFWSDVMGKKGTAGKPAINTAKL